MAALSIQTYELIIAITENSCLQLAYGYARNTACSMISAARLTQSRLRFLKCIIIKDFDKLRNAVYVFMREHKPFELEGVIK